ncbi:hypothetical protein E3_0540 [Rhodococcus phage E3]|uniref:hypothetical protein n=1 Tax=Rhodococcus phage E3 TaxID=1007869 RepID=UPI0002C6D992|nr:hypothetical protein M176_gp058 [Rhodococcus phage E3]AEQ20968.1 hypothetical protein E3_0540 [Rhodococcus phage E3]
MSGDDLADKADRDRWEYQDRRDEELAAQSLRELLKYHVPTGFCYSTRTKVDCRCHWQGVHFDEHIVELIEASFTLKMGD